MSIQSNVPNKSGLLNKEISVETVGKGMRYAGAGLVFTGFLSANPVLASIGSVMSASGSIAEFGSKVMPTIDKAFNKVFSTPQLQPALVR